MKNTNETKSCAYKEVITILSLLPDEEWNKIPKEERDFYFINMNKNYKFSFDVSRPIYEQKLLPQTKAILANIFKKYIATEQQKQEIANREKQEYIVIADKKRQQSNPNHIFKNNTNDIQTEQTKKREPINNYNKAYKEVLEILKYVPKESYEKIPKIMIKTFETKQDKTHQFKVDTTKKFEEQNILEETKDILAIIFRDYWATPHQKERITSKERYDRTQNEKAKYEKNNSKDLFNQNTNHTSRTQEHISRDIKDTIENKHNEKTSQNNLPIPVKTKKESLYKKILRVIKKILHIK